MRFFLLYIIKKYKEDAFNIQVRIGRYISQKKRYDNLNFLGPLENFDFVKILFLSCMKIVAYI